MSQQVYCTEYGRLSRRSFLTGGLITLPRALPSVAFADPHVGPRGDTLVCIFLRGGADGLNIVVPHGDDDYYRLRPTLAIGRPDDGGKTAVNLDGFFGLHPVLAPLAEFYRAGDLALVHATGSPDESRSHFEAMNLMERGATTNGDFNGWLARHLATLDTGNNSSLRGIGVGQMLQASLTGTASATALQSIADYHLHGRDEQIGQLQALLSSLYSQPQRDLLAENAARTFAALEVLAKVETSRAPNGRSYPEGEFGAAMQTVSHLIQADVGVEVACVDLGGWDTHVIQGGAEGIMANNLAELGEGIAAFYEDLQEKRESVTLLVMSEFGRRVQENGGRGTDHGHGNMMMVLGGGIAGGQVVARWPGLSREQQTGPGDLTITTDYRDVLAEIVRQRLNNPRVADVFPGYAATPLGLTR